MVRFWKKYKVLSLVCISIHLYSGYSKLQNVSTVLLDCKLGPTLTREAGGAIHTQLSDLDVVSAPMSLEQMTTSGARRQEPPGTTSAGSTPSGHSAKSGPTAPGLVSRNWRWGTAGGSTGSRST